ncbi:Gfo/Idh/MocA family protein [Romboutsia sp.]|uniref:Gfo/Idh/MocA family protein n=1 Tax=Romboutsia sp. TaxID=1965302 RepID=UPI003F387F33
MALKVGVIGLGDVSIVHLHAIKLNKKSELVAVCDIDESKRELVKDVNFYTNYKEMIEKENLDCVHICLPHYLHYPVTKDVANLGVDILLEKPLCLDTKEANKFKELSESIDTNICICLQNRYNKTTKYLQEAINSNEYGKVLGIKGLVAWDRPEEYYTLKPWRGSMKLAGGGAMINQSIHTLDLMQLFGGKIKSIKGRIDNFTDYDIEVEDTASACINFENDCRGIFFTTVAHKTNSSVEIEVIFENGEFTIKDSKLYKMLDGEKVEIIEDDKLSGTKHYYGASHFDLIDNYYNCLINDTKNYVHIEDAINSIKIIDAIRVSSKQDKIINWG